MKNIKKVILIFLALVVIFTAVIAFGVNYYLQKEHNEKMQSNENSEITSLEEVKEDLSERTNILVMGVDYLRLGDSAGQRGTRTDTIMLFSIDPNTKKSFILSIPRDSRVNIPGYGYDKVNHAHSYGGSDLSIKTISEFIGIPIHHYAKVDYNAVTELVDAVGGVEVDIKQDMNYSLLDIHFKKGVQVLNGEQAVKYLRFRSGYANADIGRISVQQDFVKLLIKKVISPSLIQNIPKYIDIIEKNVETDLSKMQMLIIARALVETSAEDMRKEILPGEGEMINGVSYWVINESMMNTMIEDLLNNDPAPEEENVVDNEN